MSEETVETTSTEEVESATTEEEVQDTTASEEESRLYANKYKSIEELEKGYENLNSLYSKRFKGFTGAPESGEYEYVKPDDIDEEVAQAILDTPMVKNLKEKGLERGMSNDMFNELINDYIATEREQVEAQLQVEFEKLGKNAEDRLRIMDEKLGTMLEPHLKSALSSALTTAEAVEALEFIMETSSPKNTVNPFGTEPKGAITEEEWQKMYLATDDYGNRKMNDPSYRKKVEKLYEQIGR